MTYLKNIIVNIVNDSPIIDNAAPIMVRTSNAFVAAGDSGALVFCRSICCIYRC